METSDWIWAGIILAGAAFETYALRGKKEGDTLSEVTRALFRTRKGKAGRVAFGVAWAGFSVWFLGHVLDWWA